jgi:endoglycosylceramidase
VDFHQDVFAAPYCGDGFPPWACPEPVPERPDDCSGWFMGYFGDDEVKAAFDRLWSNGDGLQDDFEAMWRTVAAELWQVDAVIGFEIINEPYAGSADAEPWAAGVLTPFYARMGAAIREEAPGALVFFDSTPTDAINASTDVERPDGDGFVFAPHYYNAAAFIAETIPTPMPAAGEIAMYLGRWAGRGEAWDLPVLVGEFGIKPTIDWSRDYVVACYDGLDAHLLSATIWELSTTSDEWNAESMSLVDLSGAETPVLDAAVRPHPMAVAGTILGFAHDDAGGLATLEYEAEAGGLTALSVPERVYPDGVRVTIDGVDGCVASCGPGVVVVHAAGAGTASVVVRPAR